ncbi:hypothetical protein FRC12_004541 [Ceratobasidium sp. 428]|nr:hypothetical protein FRC12_004541 [Ceratobasidium sp. 428]
MQLPSIRTRFFGFALLFLAFSMLVYAAPAALVASSGKNLLARGGTCTTGCTTGTDVVAILVKLLADIKIKLTLLDGCYNDGTDPTGIIADIVALINAAVLLILALPKDLLGLLNGKITIIVKLCVSIIIEIATHCVKWSDKPNFDLILKLCIDLDVALCALLKAVGGLLGTILGLIAGLLSSVDIALLVKLKLKLCLGILGF